MAPSPNNNSQPPLRDPLDDHRHSQLIFSASCYLMQVPPLRKRTQRFQFQAYRSRAMWPCCDFTSSDDDEHYTDNNFLLLFADVGISPTLLGGLSEVDVLRMAIGGTIPLDTVTISHQNSPTPDHEPPPLDAELEPLL